jgi:hypothetical protein
VAFGRGISDDPAGFDPKPTVQAALERHGMREGWYACPSGAAQLRYWDGSAWTERVRPDLIGWVHGRRVLDVPGVFAYGRIDPAAALGGRPIPPDPSVWRRARNALIALPLLYLAALIPAALILSKLGLSNILEQIFYIALLVTACGAYGKWMIILRYFSARYRPATAPKAPPAPPRTDVWADLRAAGYEGAAQRLDEELAVGDLSDVDFVRVARVVRQTARVGSTRRPGSGADLDLPTVVGEIEQHGGAAFVHRSGQRDLVAPRLVQHDLMTGQARLGVATQTTRNPLTHQGQWFALDTEVLRTSMLVVGPPGSGKTRSFARPIIEMLGLQALVGLASVVVIDPTGTTFGPDILPDFFDVDIDPNRPATADSWGFDLFGGAESPEEAADRLAGAVLPPDTARLDPATDSAARNALYVAIASYHAVHGGYPPLAELLKIFDLPRPWERLQAADTDGRATDLLERLAAAHARWSTDPAVRTCVERLRLLDRPALLELFDGRRRRFSMREIDKPIRVRIALPEGSAPQAARILARLAIAQFVQCVAAPDADREVFKGLIVDEAGRFVDEYVIEGLQRARAANAGIVLLAQSMGQFPEHLRSALFTGTGCKAVFAGIEPNDARHFADFWGTAWAAETTVTTGSSTSTGTGHSATPGGKKEKSVIQSITGTQSVEYRHSVSTRAVERYVWSPSDIINEVPTGHALVSLTTPDGVRIPPVLVNLRG